MCLIKINSKHATFLKKNARVLFEEIYTVCIIWQRKGNNLRFLIIHKISVHHFNNQWIFSLSFRDLLLKGFQRLQYKSWQYAEKSLSSSPHAFPFHLSVINYPSIENEFSAVC